MDETASSRTCCRLNEQSTWAVGLWCGIVLLDAAIWSRWLAGAMLRPLSAPVALGSCGTVLTVAVVVLVLWRRKHFTRNHWRAWWPEGATILLPMMWGLACGWGTSAFTMGGLLAYGGLLIAAVRLVQVWVVGIEDEVAGEPASGVGCGHEVLIPDDETPATDHSANWQRRLTLPEGDVIEGEVQVAFAAGQKEATIHLAFCPPLAVAPEIHAEDALGGDLDIRTETSHPFGARLSVRRSANWDQPETHQLAYSAVPLQRTESAA